ncbi:MCP four helix bundle domain-containing protein [Flavobacterium aestivum]|uniref:MCP four helix bundle domain-containing protein n=1 Tax=Flavobacterium aestivum TaxID=3003257 RepID=UPI002482B5B1|nr:MCP four helix bundle domain-containing protein [Flavobacterium aestivum]
MMKDLKKYSNKTKAAFVLLIVMLIILLSNFKTLQNSKKANEDINAIYNDRLVVARYIFQYANELQSIKAKAIQIKLSNIQRKDIITTALKDIQNINKLYLETVLTPKERTSFVSFQTSCSAINEQSKKSNWSQVEYFSDQALQALELLSQIQIEEGKSKLSNSNALHKGNTTFGELQIALLVILGGCALYLLMSKKNKITVKIPEPPSMN